MGKNRRTPGQRKVAKIQATAIQELRSRCACCDVGFVMGGERTVFTTCRLCGKTYCENCIGTGVLTGLGDGMVTTIDVCRNCTRLAKINGYRILPSEQPCDGRCRKQSA